MWEPGQFKGSWQEGVREPFAVKIESEAELLRMSPLYLLTLQKAQMGRWLTKWENGLKGNSMQHEEAWLGKPRD